MRSLKQIGQQAALALTLDNLKLDVCCISETRLGAVPRMELTAPYILNEYWIRCSSDQPATTAGMSGVGVALGARAEASLLDWIPVNSRLCAVRLEGYTKVNARRQAKRCLFVISAYAPTNCSSDSVKDTFYSQLRSLITKSRSSDIVVIAGDLNAQVGQLNDDETVLGGKFSYGSHRTDNGDRLLQACAEHRLFLTSTSFRRNERQMTTWKAPNGMHWTQIDHIAVSHRWRGSFQDCKSFWNTHLESDHALVRARFNLKFPSRTKSAVNRISTCKLRIPEVEQRYQNLLERSIADQSTGNVSDIWRCLSNTIQKVGTDVCGVASGSRDKHWVSDNSLALIESRRNIPSGNNCARRKVSRELKRSLARDRQVWWETKSTEMEAAHASGNMGLLFNIIRATGRKPSQVSETLVGINGQPILGKSHKLARWAEHFEEHFGWPV
ncbi:MAG: endonuclease/exonuclease/phosphatase family protein, partial [Plesiomonas sp.]